MFPGWSEEAWSMHSFAGDSTAISPTFEGFWCSENELSSSITDEEMAP